MQPKVVFMFLVVVILATLTSCATTTEGPLGERFSLEKEAAIRYKYCAACKVIMEFLSQSVKPIKNIIGVECLKFLPDDVCKDVSKIEDFIILGIVNLRKNPEQMCELINLC